MLFLKYAAQTNFAFLCFMMCSHARFLKSIFSFNHIPDHISFKIPI